MNTDIMDIASDSYDLLKVIVNSELRMGIIFLLFENESTFDQIKQEIQKQDSNISRTLKELQELKLIEKDDKKYKLTSTGYLICRNLHVVADNFYVLNRIKKQWNRHAIDNIPLCFARYLFLWKNGVFINSDYIEYYKNIDTYKEKIANSKNMKIVLPIYSKFHISAILNAVEENDAQLELVTSKNILTTIKNSQFNPIFERLRVAGKIHIWISDDNYHKLFFTVADNFASLTLFYLDESYDDSAMLFIEDMENYDLFVNLFDQYKAYFKKL